VTETIYGRHPVLEAIRAGEKISRILIAKGSRPQGSLAEILDAARATSIPVRWVDRQEMDKLGPHHQGVAAQVAGFAYASLEDCLALVRNQVEHALLLALDTVQDVHNLGTLLRTAEAVGVQGILLPKHRAAGVTATVRKTSAGAVEHLCIVQVTNLVRALKDLKKAGLWIIGLDMAAEKAYDEIDWRLPVVLVVGSEGQGLSRLTRATCDLLVCLPMRGQVGSLNAAVAGSIVLYTAWRARRS